MAKAKKEVDKKALNQAVVSLMAAPHRDGSMIAFKENPSADTAAAVGAAITKAFTDYAKTGKVPAKKDGGKKDGGKKAKADKPAKAEKADKPAKAKKPAKPAKKKAGKKAKAD